MCIGRLKKSHQRHCWVMTLNVECDQVTFWEIGNGNQYVLERRVRRSKRLRKFMTSFTEKHQEKGEENDVQEESNMEFKGGLLLDKE